MKNELDFAEHSRLLGEGLFGDNVVLALSHFSQTRQIGQQEKEVFERAKGFLETIVEGGHFSGATFHSARDITAAKTFNNVLGSTAGPKLSKSEFLKSIDILITVISKILDDRDANADELSLLEGFFSKYGKVHFQRSRGMLEAV